MAVLHRPTYASSAIVCSRSSDSLHCRPFLCPHHHHRRDRQWCPLRTSLVVKEGQGAAASLATVLTSLVSAGEGRCEFQGKVGRPERADLLAIRRCATVSPLAISLARRWCLTVGAFPVDQTGCGSPALQRHEHRAFGDDAVRSQLLPCVALHHG